MKKLFFAFIFPIFTFSINAQQQKISQYDSLKNYSNDSLQKLAVSYKFKNSSKAKVYASELYSRAITDKQLLYNASYVNAEIYNILEEKDSAFRYVDIAIKQANLSNNQEHYVNSLRLKGNIYYDADLYEEAAEIYVEVYKLVEKQGDIKKLADIRHSIALLKKEVGLPKEAIELAKTNWDLYTQNVLDKNEQPIKYINTLLSLSNIYIHLGENYPEGRLKYLDSAEVHNDKGLQVSLEAKDLQGLSIFLAMKGKIAQNRDNLDQALSAFEEAEELIKKQGFNNQLSLLYQFIGKNYFLQNDYDNAIKYLLKVDSIVAPKKTNTPSVKETYILLAKSYEKKNDPQKALKYFKIFEDKDSKDDASSSKVSQNLYKQYDVLILKNKIELLVSQSEKEQLKSKTLICICLFLVILFFVGFWYYKRRERTHKNRFKAILKELKEKSVLQQNEKEKKSQPYVITDENVRKILEGLERFEAKKIFLQKKCTLNYVAKKINTNSTYLSKTLQLHKEKKFVQYITDLRLDYALRQLKNDKKFRTYDIKSIASELGFNTSESFSKAFKKRTGIYPSFYIKNLNELREEEGDI